MNDKIHNYVKKNIIVNFIIQKLKSKHTSLKKCTNWANLIYFSLILREREEKKNQIFCTFVATSIALEREEWVKVLEFLAEQIKMSTFSKSIPCFKWDQYFWISDLNWHVWHWIYLKKIMFTFKLVSCLVFPEIVFPYEGFLPLFSTLSIHKSSKV